MAIFIGFVLENYLLKNDWDIQFKICLNIDESDFFFPYLCFH